MNSKRIGAILLLNIFLLACRASAPAGRPATTTATAAPTAALTVQPTQTSTPAATATVTPELALTAIPTRAPTRTPRPTATADIAATVVALSPPELHDTYLSPNGEWRAEIIIYPCVQLDDVNVNAYEQLILVRIGTGDEEVVDSQLQSCGGLGAAGLDGLFWSPNSRYFYFTTAREGFPDGCGYWEPPIFRLDVRDQSIASLGGGTLSPDGTKLATWQAEDLVVWNVDEGDEVGRAAVLVPDAGLGPIAWSPDSSALLYIQVSAYCPLAGASYLVRHDLPDLEPQLLLESDAPTFGGAAWSAADEIRLFDENGDEWHYEVATGELNRSP